MTIYDPDFPLQLRGDHLLVIHEPGKEDITTTFHEGQLPAINALRNLIAAHFSWEREGK